MSTIIVSVINLKGGTGKTTTAMNLGAALAHESRKVLLIDLDPQAALTFSAGMNPAPCSIADVVEGTRTLKQVMYKTENFSMIPANADLAALEMALAREENPECFLRDIVHSIKGFDYIIIDAPPSISLLTYNAITAADEVILPLQPEVLSVRGMELATTLIHELSEKFNPGLVIRGILLTMVDNSTLGAEIEQWIKDHTEENIFRTRIRKDEKIREAPSYGASVIHYSPGSPGAKNYITFAQEFLKTA